MSIKIMSEVWESAKVDGAPLLVLLALADYANDNGICWPAVATLAKKTRVSERHVRRILGALERNGNVAIGFREGPMGVNVYKVLVGDDTLSEMTLGQVTADTPRGLN